VESQIRRAILDLSESALKLPTVVALLSGAHVSIADVHIQIRWRNRCWATVAPMCHRAALPRKSEKLVQVVWSEPDAGTREHMNRGRHMHDLMRATRTRQQRADLQAPVRGAAAQRSVARNNRARVCKAQDYNVAKRESGEGLARRREAAPVPADPKARHISVFERFESFEVSFRALKQKNANRGGHPPRRKPTNRKTLESTGLS